MIIAFRVDSSDIIGTGHVQRCLHFAQLYRNNNTIIFITKKHLFSLTEKIKKNYTCYEMELENSNKVNLDYNTWLGEDELNDAEKTISILKENNIDVDWLIVDHYAIQKTWEQKVKPFVKKICVIDDFTHRIHDCHLLINQQITQEEGLEKYKDLLNKNCQICCGNDYLLIHPSYYHYKYIQKNDHKKQLKKINIFMGGADSFNITEIIIDLCSTYNNHLEEKIDFDVIVGKSNKHYKKLQEKIKKLENFHYYYDLEFIGDLLDQADLCIGAPGSTSYERCLMKIPCLCICIADNQKTVIDKFIKANCIQYLGTLEDNYQQKLIYYLEYFQNNSYELKKMSINCEQIIDLKKNKINVLLDGC
jgi:UDP-2,4-diacetamido-2,4,6-trideoxy-beta-L-altropyranose hydrolase